MIDEKLLGKPIRTEEDYKRFVFYVVKELEVNYHPDNDFEDYLDRKGERSFTQERAAQLNQRNHEAFELLGQQIYSVALDEFRRVFP